MAETVLAGTTLSLALAAALAWGVRSPGRLWLLILWLSPLALEVPAGLPGARLSVPLEPLMACFAAVTGVALLHRGRLDGRLLRHPVTLAVLLQTSWMLLASGASSLPSASIKHALSTVLYTVVFYGGGLWVLGRPGGVPAVLVAGASGWIPAMAYVLHRHALGGFAAAATYDAGQPLFRSRLEYAAGLVAWLPLLAAMVLAADPPILRRGRRWIAALAVAMLAAVVLCRARSALLALGAALAVMALALQGARPRRTVAVAALSAALAAAVAWDLVAYRSRLLHDGGLGVAPSATWDAALSLPVFKDVSLQERLNRWAAAARVFSAHPWLGSGPGTFERAYGPHQSPFELTISSTTAGDLGDAHSEYLTALAEQGLPGLLCLLALIGAIALAALRVARGPTPWGGAGACGTPLPSRVLGAAIAASLAGLAVEGAFNGLLDLDKIAPLFFTLAALAATLDARGRALPQAVAEDDDAARVSSGSGVGDGAGAAPRDHHAGNAESAGRSGGGRSS